MACSLVGWPHGELPGLPGDNRGGETQAPGRRGSSPQRSCCRRARSCQSRGTCRWQSRPRTWSRLRPENVSAGDALANPETGRARRTREGQDARPLEHAVGELPGVARAVGKRQDPRAVALAEESARGGLRMMGTPSPRIKQTKNAAYLALGAKVALESPEQNPRVARVVSMTERGARWGSGYAHARAPCTGRRRRTPPRCSHSSRCRAAGNDPAHFLG